VASKIVLGLLALAQQSLPRVPLRGLYLGLRRGIIVKPRIAAPAACPIAPVAVPNDAAIAFDGQRQRGITLLVTLRAWQALSPWAQVTRHDAFRVKAFGRAHDVLQIAAA
jgi:hypothetical protein